MSPVDPNEFKAGLDQLHKQVRESDMQQRELETLRESVDALRLEASQLRQVLQAILINVRVSNSKILVLHRGHDLYKDACQVLNVEP